MATCAGAKPKAASALEALADKDGTLTPASRQAAESAGTTAKQVNGQAEATGQQQGKESQEVTFACCTQLLSGHWPAARQGVPGGNICMLYTAPVRPLASSKARSLRR